MASYWRTRDSRGRPFGPWRYRFKGADGKTVNGTGWDDLARTKRHVGPLEDAARDARMGGKPTAEINARTMPIAEVIAAYLAWGAARGGRGGRPWDDFHHKGRRLGLEWWKTELSLLHLADIDLARVDKVVQKLLADKAPKTVFLKVECLRSFCRWAILRGYMTADPLVGLGKLDKRPQEPHRPLTADELARLLAVAPPERRIAYEVALETGFRLDELKHLQADALRPGPFLFVSGDYTKNRKDALQPITRELADKLLPLTRGKRPTDSLLEIPTNAHRYFKRDCRNAKPRIEPSTDAGRATWHSLRKCFDDALIRSGGDLKTIMTLMRHSTPTLTLQTYASADPARLRDAAARASDHLKTAVDCAESQKSVKVAAVAGGAEEPLSAGRVTLCGHSSAPSRPAGPIPAGRICPFCGGRRS